MLVWLVCAKRIQAHCDAKSIAQEKINSERYGATGILCDSVPFTDKNHYFHVAEVGKEVRYFYKSVRELNNGNAHFDTTGPEIYQALDGRWMGSFALRVQVEP